MKCSFCDDTGKFDIPVNDEVFEREFERLDSIGRFDMETCREKALELSGRAEVVCPICLGECAK